MKCKELDTSAEKEDDPGDLEDNLKEKTSSKTEIQDLPKTAIMGNLFQNEGGKDHKEVGDMESLSGRTPSSNNCTEDKEERFKMATMTVQESLVQSLQLHRYGFDDILYKLLREE